MYQIILLSTLENFPYHLTKYGKLWIWEIIKTILNAQQNKTKQAKAFDILCVIGKAKNQRTFVIRLVLPVTDHLKMEKNT